ncbi:creatininase family protein [Planococcus salinus]|nr:creatininase family protein [Planococcus salinus]
MPVYKWNEMSREQIGDLAKEAMVVVPIGATEQHGPHLPVETDNVIIQAVSQQSVEKAGAQIPIVLAPLIPFGFSHHHFLYPGVLSLSIQTLITVLNDLIESVIKSGFTQIFIVNGHGGNDEVIRLAAREMALKYPVTVGAASYWTVAAEEMGAYAKQHQISELPGHAGQFETSLMLALQPNHVQLEKLSLASKERHAAGKSAGPGKVMVENTESWKQIDGFTDHPEKAEEQLGRDLLKIISDKVASELIAFYGSRDAAD